MAVRSPLFDIFDPYETLQAGLLPEADEEIDPIGLIPIRRKPTISDLLPREEKRGMLRSLAEMGSSGLSAVGYLLDSPGALVRGVLAGRPLSVFGTSDERVTGRELLRQYGMVGDEDTWGNFGLGLAGEILLDPLTYANPLAILGRGALTPVGKALQGAGRMRNAAEAAYEGLEPTLQQAARGAQAREAGTGVREYLRGLTPRQALAEAPDPVDAMARWRQQAERFGVDPNNLDAPAARLMDVRIPGTNIGFSTDLLGGAFGDRVAQGLDYLGEASKTNPYTGPAVRALYAGFKAPVKSLDYDVQWDSRLARAAADRADEAQELLRSRQLREAMNAAVPDTATINGVSVPIPDRLRRFHSTDLQRALVDFAESSSVPTAPGAFGPVPKSSGDAVADWVLENVPEFREIRDLYQSSTRQARSLAEQAGLSTQSWQSQYGTEFFPRQTKWWRRILNPERPNAVGRTERPWTQGERVLNTTDNFGRGRRDYTDIAGGQRTFRMLTGNANANLDSAALQQALINAEATPARGILNRAFDAIGVQRPFQEEYRRVIQSPEFLAATPQERAAMLRPVRERMNAQQDELVNFLRGADLQFAQTNTGVFDTPGWTNLRRYERGQNRALANADRVTARLEASIQTIGPNGLADGMVQLSDAASRLGYDPQNFRQMWQNRFGQDVTNLAVPERLVASLKTLSQPTRLGDVERGIVGTIDQFTNAFKVGALAAPAFHVRNTYSGALNAATFGAFNPLDWWAAFRASGGNYNALERRLRNAPGFQALTPQQRIARFQDLTGANRIGGGTIFDDVTNLPEQEIRGTWLGAGNEPSVAEAFYSPGRSWGEFLNDFFSMRGVGVTQNPNPRNTNPLLVANDALGSRVEDALRGGTFLNQLRKGVDPGEAADLVRLSQVDYSPSAFTDFERTVLKRALPFYSFQKGIIPSITNNLLYRPGGLMGQSVRAVTRGTQPTEDSFLPEYMRQSAAIPLPENLPFILGGSGKEGLRRYLTNIDLPWESTFQLFTPGVGATTSSAIADTIKKTGSNVLGMTNPLIKAPLEYVTNRQLYTGRDLTDLYSVLERDLGEVGRPLEQLAVNFLPFGSRGIGLYRQLTDQRLDPSDRYMKAAWNLLAGTKLTDIDQERSKQLAARQMLNDMLQTTPGVRTYENVTVPEDVLRGMPREQQQMYLLYKVIQSEAAKRAREKKKANLDPLQVLGVVQQF
ncbi:MAG: hypothetical protein EBT15_07135 [Betaproteobacteria bacterium]|nr:hypothetical protein [Betaproteobacteria bacterium]